MPAKKIYAQDKLDLGGGKVIEKGGVIATIDSDLPVDRVVNLLYAGQAAEVEPAKESKPAVSTAPAATEAKK